MQLWNNSDEFYMKYAFNVTRICFTLKGKNCSVKLSLQGKYYVPIVYYNEGFLPSAALHRMLMCDVFKELLCLSSALLWLPPAPSAVTPPLSPSVVSPRPRRLSLKRFSLFSRFPGKIPCMMGANSGM